MPYLRIQTNQPVPPDARAGLTARASRLVAEQTGKPEQWVMVALEPDTTMRFAGTEAPAAYLELKSIGLTEGDADVLAGVLSELVTVELGVPPARIYIELSSPPEAFWGWNGGTMAD